MTGIMRRVRKLWDAVRWSRYRARAKGAAQEEQRYADRQARHEAGIPEPPGPGSGM